MAGDGSLEFSRSSDRRLPPVSPDPAGRPRNTEPPGAAAPEPPGSRPDSNFAATISETTSREDLIEAISEFIPGGSAGRRQGALVIAAIGNLSLINEAFGFHVGDEVITIVGRRLQGCLRERDCFARYGSNKFGIVLADCEPETLDFVASRLFKAVRESIIETSVGAVSMTVRLGGVLLPQQAKTVHEAFSNALDALDSARLRSGDCFVLFDDSEGRESQRKRNILIVDQVIRALNERRMVLALQPIIRCGGRETAFYECLLRMQKPDGTYVAAADFIQVAEKLGLARLIDHRVAELAVGLLRSAPNLSLSMNVSGGTASDLEWLSALHALTRGDRSVTERLMIEITETAVITDIEESVGFVKSAKQLGCQVAIDDFGAGYSSFKNLRVLDVDMVKIDGSFVKDLSTSRDDLFLVKTLVDLARNFNMKTVAEWVGDEETARLVERAGVDYMQGFFFGQPQLVGGPGGQKPQDPVQNQPQYAAVPAAPASIHVPDQSAPHEQEAGVPPARSVRPAVT